MTWMAAVYGVAHRRERRLKGVSMVHPEAGAYLAEVRSALTHPPEGAARLTELERVSGSAPATEERREAGIRIGELLDEAFDEVDAARRAVGRPMPQRGNAP
jgi:hypothetical protein